MPLALNVAVNVSHPSQLLALQTRAIQLASHRTIPAVREKIQSFWSSVSISEWN